jgi:hypothetical protein
MEEEQQAKNQTNNPSESTPPTQVSQPVSSVPTEPQAEAQLDEVEHEVEAVERDMNAFERGTLRWTRATFIILAVTCLFIGFQWYEMNSGSVDTHTLAIAAKSAADTARKALALSDQSAANTLAEMQKQSKAMQDATASSNLQVRESKTAIRENSKAFMQGNRAYMTMENISLMAIPKSPEVPRLPGRLREAGPIPIVMATLLNSGNTPAQDAKTLIWFELKPKIEPHPCQWSPGDGLTNSASVVSRGDHIYPSQTLMNGPIGQNELPALGGERLFLVAFGCVAYKDIFNKPHLTTFCAAWKPNLDQMVGCSQYNELVY